LDEPRSLDQPVPCVNDGGCGAEFNLNGNFPVNNNFGGQGPDGGPEEIRFKHAANYECQPIDLVMTAGSPYTPGTTPNTNNGGRNGFGYVTTYAGHAVDVELSLVNSVTGAPFVVDELSIWMYDLDMGKKGRGKESVEICGATNTRELAPEGKRELVKGAGGPGCTKYSASVVGTAKDNPTDMYTLTEQQQGRALKATWADSSKAKVRVAIGEGGGGRSFQFTATALKLCPTTTTTTTPPRVCKPGKTDNTNPCKPKTCANDGMTWMEATVDCPEALNVPCLGNWVKPAAGQCCSTCVETTTTTTTEFRRPVTPPPGAKSCSSFEGVADKSLLEDCTNGDMFEFKLSIYAPFEAPTFAPHEYGSDAVWNVWPVPDSAYWSGTEGQNCVAYVETDGKTCEQWCDERKMTCVAGMDDAHDQTDDLYNWLQTEGYPKTHCTLVPAGHTRQSTDNNGCNQKWGTQICSCTASNLKETR